MQREQIVFVGTSDLSGHFRGKSFPALDLPARLHRGVGMALTNIFLSAFGPIQATTFGTRGEVFLVPDPTTRVFVPFENSVAEFFFIGDIRTGDGAPWDFCPRHVLRRALDRLKSETGLKLFATFEQEFLYTGVAAHPPQPYELDAYRRQGYFGEALLAAMRQVGTLRRIAGRRRGGDHPRDRAGGRLPARASRELHAASYTDRSQQRYPYSLEFSGSG